MGKKKLPEKEKPKGLPLWLGTFGDLMSLLLTFFILLLSMATFDKERVDQAMGSLRGALSILEHGVETEITPPNPIQASPIVTHIPTEDAKNIFSSLITEYNDMTKVADGPSIDLEESEDGFIIRIPDDLLFKSGSSAIENEYGILFLQRISMQISDFRDKLRLKIVGNTDNVPYARGSRIDNWDLSVKRALSVADKLASFGVPLSIVQTGGEGDFNPIATNESASGRAKNRRVDIYFREIEIRGDEGSVAKDMINRIQTK